MLSAATAGAGVLSAADAFAIEPGFSLAVARWKVKHPDWPASARPLRIGMLTDIHAVEPWMSAGRIGAIVDRMNALKPDLVVLLGDYVNALRPRFCAAPVPVAEWMAPLSELVAPAGVFAVLGNHDWWAGEVPQIRRGFEKAGIHLLVNDAVCVSRGASKFWVAGLDDQLAYKTHGADDLQGTLRLVSGKLPVLLLAHEPMIFPKVPSRVTLTLAGHTHGGQVYVPFIGRPALGPHYSAYGYGHFREDGRQLIVSSGLGLSGYPVRFLVPPEIALVTLSNLAIAQNLNVNLRHQAQTRV